MEKKHLARVNITMSRNIKSYFEEKSKEMGIPQSALMVMALEEHIRNQEVLKFNREGLPQMLAKLDELLKNQ